MEVNDFQNNYGDGWIKLFRSIRNHWIWKDENKLKWWLDILLEVNHSDKKVNIGYDIYECKTGQSIMSRRSWAKRWNVSKTTVDNFFHLLLKDNMITIKSYAKTSQITVCNYDTYQQQQAKEKPVEDHNSTTTVLQTRIKELKNERSKKNNPFIIPEISEVEAYFYEKGYRKDAGKKFYEYYSVANWHDSKGNQIVNWKQKAQAVWFKEENKKPGQKLAM